MQNEETAEILKIIKRWQDEKKYGQIVLNFCAGKVPHVNLHETRKLRSNSKPVCEKVVSF